MRTWLGLTVVGAFLIGATVARSQAPSPMGATEHKAMAPTEIQWGDPPPVFVKSARFAVLYGDPTRPGVYIVRLKMPSGYKVMPHWHPVQENVSVISGEFHVGMGDKFDETGMQALQPGSFAAMPAHMHHFAVAKGETIVQVNGIAPFKLIYVNASDDPSKKK